MGRVRVEILGIEYNISTNEKDTYVQQLAEELNEKAKSLMEANPWLSQMAALVLCALDSADACKKSEESSDHMRTQLTEYLEDAAKARIELDDAKRELERVKRQLKPYQEREKLERKSE